MSPPTAFCSPTPVCRPVGASKRYRDHDPTHSVAWRPASLPSSRRVPPRWHSSVAWRSPRSICHLHESSGFEPVLNLPAMSSFLIITTIFVALQFRIGAIRNAVDRRTKALSSLQKAKAKELEGTVSHEQVVDALRQYRLSFDEEERLRNVAPGVRIAPSDHSSRNSQSDVNRDGARRFLGLDVEQNASEIANDNQRLLPIPLAALLATVAFSLVLLLGLLSVDPMVSSSDMGATMNDWTGLE